MPTTRLYPLAFYIGAPTWADRLVRLWTRSPYSHSELGRTDGLFGSSNRLTRLYELHPLSLSPHNWEVHYLRLPVEIMQQVEKEQEARVGSRYDWLGIILGYAFPLGLHSRMRWFCSKSNTHDLQRAIALMRQDPQRYAPYLATLAPYTRYPSFRVSPALLHRLTKEAIKLQQHISPVSL